MHLFDPARPKFGNHRAYVFEGRAIGPMPAPQILPLDSGTFLVQFMLLVDTSTGRYFSLETSDVNSILAQFVTDPEEFFISCLKYQPPKVKTKKMREDEIMSSILKDLGI